MYMYINETLIIIFSYLLGSTPFGLIVAKAAGMGDIRKKGSGNIGATNVSRAGGKKLGLITLLLDGGKGAVAVLIARHLGDSAIEVIAALAAVMGHVFPVWLRFKGGKGVATTFAVYLALNPVVGAFSLSIWLAVFGFARISSVAALVSVIATPLFVWLVTGDMGIFYLSIFLAALIVIRHKSNIQRLLKGEEK